MSGGGKSTAIRALEDAGWFCIDNLPVLLVPKLLELVVHGASDEVHRLALVIDAREGRFLDQTPQKVDEVRRAGHRLEVVFLDSADETLSHRFSETRRRHPLSPDGTVAEGIALERKLLAALRGIADVVIDTTRMNVHELRDVITARFGEGLKPHPGTDPRVSEWVLGRPQTQEFLEHLESLLAFLLPQYKAEGKSYLTVSIGCTGGRHRSVALAEELSKRLTDKHRARVKVTHRDVAKA